MTDKKEYVLTRQEYGKRLGKSIGLLLIRNKMTQKDLADATGLSYSSICRYVSGNRIPSSYELFRIADVFGCDASQLIRAEA